MSLSGNAKEGYWFHHGLLEENQGSGFLLVVLPWFIPITTKWKTEPVSKLNAMFYLRTVIRYITVYSISHLDLVIIT